jgi:hypothetical protein
MVCKIGAAEDEIEKHLQLRENFLSFFTQRFLCRANACRANQFFIHRSLTTMDCQTQERSCQVRVLWDENTVALERS